MSKVVGLDPSLTATGVASTSGQTRLLRPGKRRGPERLVWIRENILSLVSGAELVVVEGYSYGSQHSHAHALGELGGVVRVALFEAGIPYLDIPPSTLKKYATGKGNAKKELVLVEAVKRLDYPGANDNEADALWLRAIGREVLGDPIVELPKVHLKAMEKVGEITKR